MIFAPGMYLILGLAYMNATPIYTNALSFVVRAAVLIGDPLYMQ